MRFAFFFLLLLVALAQCQYPDENFDEFAMPTEKTITFTQDQVTDMAENIMKTMDKSIESRNYTDLLNLHCDDFTFNFCQLDGSTVEGLKVYLENNEILKKVKKSKHVIIPHSRDDDVEILDVHGFRFDYQKYFQLKNDHIIRTFGTIIVRTQYGKIEIVKAVEYCPTEVL